MSIESRREDDLARRGARPVDDCDAARRHSVMGRRTRGAASLFACVVAWCACGARPPVDPSHPPPGQWVGVPAPPVAASSPPLDNSQSQATHPAPPQAPSPVAPSAAWDPRCPKDVFDGSGGVDTVRDAVAACVNGQFVGDAAAVAVLKRAIGTRTGEGTPIKCRGGIPSIALIDARGRAAVLTFCAQLGVREARVGGLQAILTADPAGIEAWLRERGVDVAQMR